VGEDLLDHHRIFDAGNDLDVTAAALAGLDVNVEDTFQALRPSHGGPAFGGRGVFGRIRRVGFVALAALARRHLCTVCAVGGEDSVEPSEVDPGFGHQGDQARNEVHRLEDDVCGAVAVRCLECVAHMAVAQQRPPLLRHRGSCDIAAQAFRFLRPCAAPRVRRESRYLSDRVNVQFIAARWNSVARTRR
jgi:hypothetical protein